MSSYLRVLRHPDFRYLFLGQSASAVGDQAVIVALALYVTQRTGSATDLGLVLAAQTVPLLALLLFGGVWADRLERRRIMIASDGARFALHGLLAVLIFAGGASVWQLVVIEALFGAARAFFQPAYTGMVPETVPSEDLNQDAQALTKTTANLAILIGPALGTALVLGLGAGTAFALDAATFALSAALLVRVRPRARGGAAGESAPGSVLGDLREGFAEVAARPWVWASIVAFTVAVLCGYATWYSLAPIISRELYGAVRWFGVLESAAGAGALLGALLGVRWRPRRPLALGLLLSLWWVVQGIAFALHAPLASVVVLSVLAGLGFSLFEIWWETALVVHIPPRALSRVSSYDWMGSLAFLPIGFALSGPLASLLGARWVLGVGTAVAGVALVGALAPRSTRALSLPEQLDDGVGVEAGGEREVTDVDPLVRVVHERRRAQ